MTRARIHDTNVRVAAATPARAPRPARPSRLARLLLDRLVGVAGIAALLSSMPACVPVAPDFQDPVSSPNVPPWLHDPNFSFGYNIPVLLNDNSSTSFPIHTLVTDLNVGDVLNARWIINYPPAHSNTLVIEKQDGLHRLSPTTAEPELDITCAAAGPGGWTSVPTPQQLELVVADGPFTNSDPLLPDEVVDGAHQAYANWTISMQCPSAGTGASP